MKGPQSVMPSHVVPSSSAVASPWLTFPHQRLQLACQGGIAEQLSAASSFGQQSRLSLRPAVLDIVAPEQLRYSLPVASGQRTEQRSAQQLLCGPALLPAVPRRWGLATGGAEQSVQSKSNWLGRQ